MAAAALPRLLVMSDSQRLPDPLAVLDRLPAGAGMILRHYRDPEREDLAYRLARACRWRGVVLLVAGDPGLARRCGADGLHLAEHQARRIAGCGRLRRPRPGFLVTAAAHSPAALARAARLGADAALLSPVFPTASHPGSATLGAGGLARLVAGACLPVYALGGISAANAGRLLGLPLAGFAGIGGLGR